MFDDRYLFVEYIATNPKNLEKSKIRIPEVTRSLTLGEIAMCKTIFANSIRYQEVKINARNYMTMGAMGVGGEIYFNPKRYEVDYSMASRFIQEWFIHEMTHVWQYQKGYPVFKIGLDLQAVMITNNVEPYMYNIMASKLDTNNQQILSSFQDYNMESQACILAHYYAIFINPPPKGDKKETLKTIIGNNHKGYDYLYIPDSTKNMRLANLKRVAESFIKSDKNSNWLPKKWIDFNYLVKEAKGV